MSSEIPVSVVVLTKNEERNLRPCLDSVARFAQVFVVDSGSVDQTCAIAENHRATVVQFQWDGGYPKKKQWALENLPFVHEWVIFVDADERVTPELADELEQLFDAEIAHAGYFVELEYAFLGRRLKHGHRVIKLALLNRRRARFVDYPDLEAANMWEVEGHYQPVIDGTTGVLSARILHEDHESLFHWFERHNRYSDWEAVLAAAATRTTHREAQPRHRALQKRIFARVPLRGAVAFVWYYVFRRGFLDGRAGFHYALAKAFYYWQVGVKTRELRAARELDRRQPFERRGDVGL
jgi:glycosyltransferase involved in cell wall biosynthesis